jgi:hypothetical protein
MSLTASSPDERGVRSQLDAVAVLSHQRADQFVERSVEQIVPPFMPELAERVRHARLRQRLARLADPE